MRANRSVLFAGGGTVGHLAPGFAVARALERLGVPCRFATPGSGEESEWFGPGAPSRVRLPAARPPRGGLEVPAFAARFAGSFLRAVRLLQRERPRAVVALGGWPCVPAALAARALGVPLFFVASDRTPGIVVRRLGGGAERVYLAEESAAAALPRASVVVSGPILRAGMGHGRRDPARFGLDPRKRTLLVVGGSLGAKALNERVVAGFEAALGADPGLRERVQVLHSTGRNGGGVDAAYARLRITHHATPFLREMEIAWPTADLALSRAGALACAEIEATRTASVLVPYPHHADRQQFRNAGPLVDRGAAVLVEEERLTPEVFRETVLGLLLDDVRLGRMRSRATPETARGVGDATGAGRVAQDLVRWLTKRPAGDGGT